MTHAGAMQEDISNEALVLAATNRRRTPIAERVFARIDAGGDCWDWTGSRSRLGYGSHSFKVGSRILNVRAHRLVWALLVGPIPAGLTLDHRCRRPSCCNPDHLEPVSHRENLRRSPIALGQHNSVKTRCKHGHAFTPENTYRTRRGTRVCRACLRAAMRRYYVRKTSAQEAA